jgi:hypothetical protein
MSISNALSTSASTTDIMLAIIITIMIEVNAMAIIFLVPRWYHGFSPVASCFDKKLSYNNNNFPSR